MSVAVDFDRAMEYWSSFFGAILFTRRPKGSAYHANIIGGRIYVPYYLTSTFLRAITSAKPYLLRSNNIPFDIVGMHIIIYVIVRFLSANSGAFAPTDISIYKAGFNNSEMSKER